MRRAPFLRAVVASFVLAAAGSSATAAHAAGVDPTKATAEAGNAFIDAAVDGLVETFKNLQGSYQERR